MSNEVLLRSYLKRLRLPVIAQNYSRLAKEAAANNQSYQDYLAALFEGEVLQRDENAQKLRLSKARFPIIKMLDSFDFSVIPSVNKAMIIELARCSFIDRRENANIYRKLWHRENPSGDGARRGRLPAGKTSALLHRRRPHQRPA